MTSEHTNGGWLGMRSVALWTVIAGVVAVLGFAFTIVSSLVTPKAGPTADVDGKPPAAVETSLILSLKPDASRPANSAPLEMYLADMPAVGGSTLVDPHPVTMSGLEYSHTAILNTGYVWQEGSDTQWNLGGKATRLTATVGINDAEDASGIKVHVTFYGDDHRPLKTVTVSVARPQKISIDVSGVVRLTIACIPEMDQADGRNLQLALGDAKVLLKPGERLE